MNQQRKYVILCPEIVHIILKAEGIYPDTLTSKHPHNILPESVKIHIHIDFQRLIGLCGSPVIRKITAFHCRYDRPGIIDVLKLPENISVIPVADSGKIHIILFAQ